MQRPVEINRKKSQLLLAALVALAGTAGLIWLHGSKGMTFSWKGVLDVIPIVLMGGTCLAAFVSLIVSLFSHEPYLLIYDDRIEMPRLLSRNYRVLHFCDVKSMKKDGNNKALFILQPYLKRSDLPGWTRLMKRFLGTDFGISLIALDMPSKDAYKLMYDRYQRYHHQNRRGGVQTEDEELDNYLSRLAKRVSIGRLNL